MATQAELKARLSLDTALFEKGIAAAHAGAGKLGSAFGAVGGAGMAMWGKLAAAAAALGGAAGFVSATKHVFDFGDELDELSKRTGMTVSNLVVLQQAFRQAGLDAADVGGAINRMQRFIEKAGPEKLGEAFYQIRQMKPEQQFQMIAQVIDRLPTATERAAAAMEIFGRGGGKLLALFRDAGQMNEIQQVIGKQALLLQQNAEIFSRIADRLKLAGEAIKGFFVGVAEKVAPFIDELVERLLKIDFTEMGQNFGKALVAGLKMVVGFFQNTQLFFTALTEGLKAAFLEVGNILLAVMKAAVVFFKDAFVNILVGIGSILTATLMEAFHKPLVWFQAQMVGGIFTMQKVLEALSPKPMMPWTRINLLNQAGAAGAKIAEEEFQKNINQPLRMGLTTGVMTPADYRAQGQKALAEAFDAAKQAMAELKPEDVTGAGAALQKALDAAKEAIDEGGKTLDEMFKKKAKQTEQAIDNFMFVFARPPNFTQAFRDPYIAGAIQGAHGTQGALGLGGPQMIITDRQRRREAFLAQAGKDNLGQTNRLLGEIKTATQSTAKAWDEK